jgi:hypothetical protein
MSRNSLKSVESKEWRVNLFSTLHSLLFTLYFLDCDYFNFGINFILDHILDSHQRSR